MNLNIPLECDHYCGYCVVKQNEMCVFILYFLTFRDGTLNRLPQSSSCFVPTL